MSAPTSMTIAARYVSLKPRAMIRCEDDLWLGAGRETLDVIIADGQPVETGLVDAGGTPIMRITAKAPVGFCR